MSRVAQSVQRLATGWTVQGSNPGEAEVFRTCPDRPWGPPSLLYNGYRVFPGGKKRPGCEADPSLPSSAVVMKGQSYTSTPPMGRTACIRPQCLYKGDLYFTFVADNCHGKLFAWINQVCCLINYLVSGVKSSEMWAGEEKSRIEETRKYWEVREIYLMGYMTRIHNLTLLWLMDRLGTQHAQKVQIFVFNFS